MDDLARLAALYGVATTYQPSKDVTVTVPRDTVRAVLGHPVGERARGVGLASYTGIQRGDAPLVVQQVELGQAHVLEHPSPAP